MKPLLSFILFAVTTLYLSYAYAQSITPPVIKKVTKVFTEHGNERTDDYYWMNNPADTNVINHLKTENAYVESYMNHTEELQKKLYNELVARIPGKDESLPVKRNGYWYYTRFEEGQQYPYYARKKGTTTNKEEITLNVPELAKKNQIYLVRGWQISTDNQALAYGIDTLGDRRSILYIKNLLSSELHPDKILNTSGDYVWANDNTTIYYVKNDHTVRPYKVMKHILGSDANTDTEIYSEKDSTYEVGLSKSKNNRYIFIRSATTNTNEDRYLDANNPSALPVLIQPRRNNVEYRTDHFEGDVFHVYTNKHAKNFKFVTAPVNNPGIETWKM